MLVVTGALVFGADGGDGSVVAGGGDGSVAVGGAVGDVAVGGIAEAGALTSASIAPPHAAIVATTRRELKNLKASKLLGESRRECIVDSCL